MADSLDDGAVAVTLAGRERRLVPTLAAAKAISRRFGDLNKASERVISRDFGAAVAIVRAGLADENFPEDEVWRAGLTRLMPVLVEYVEVLANGGRPLGQDAGREARPDAAAGER